MLNINNRYGGQVQQIENNMLRAGRRPRGASSALQTEFSRPPPSGGLAPLYAKFAHSNESTTDLLLSAFSSFFNIRPLSQITVGQIPFLLGWQVPYSGSRSRLARF